MGGSLTIGYTTVVVTAARTGLGDGPEEQGWVRRQAATPVWPNDLEFDLRA
jgi:hypothetical protein